MKVFLNIVLAYLVVINVVAFFVFGIDKRRAKRSMWRISESTLLWLAVVGGSVGAWLGMIVWRHKTMHKKFKYGIPLILIAQMTILLLVSCKSSSVAELSEPVHSYQSVPEHSPNVFLVSYDAAIGKVPLLAAVEDYGCEIVYDYKIGNGMALRKPEGKTIEETMQYFRTVKGVKTVEYDYIIRLTDPVKPRLEVR